MGLVGKVLKGDSDVEWVRLDRSWKVEESWNSWCGRVLEGYRSVDLVGLERSWKITEVWNGWVPGSWKVIEE